MTSVVQDITPSYCIALTGKSDSLYAVGKNVIICKVKTALLGYTRQLGGQERYIQDVCGEHEGKRTTWKT